MPRAPSTLLLSRLVVGCSLLLALLAAAGCSPANQFDLNEYSTMVIPDFDGVTTVGVDDVTNNTFLPSPFNGGEERGGWAENLRVEVDGHVIASADTADFGDRLAFDIDGVPYGLNVEGFDIHTFGTDSVTLLFYQR